MLIGSFDGFEEVKVAAQEEPRQVRELCNDALQTAAQVRANLHTKDLRQRCRMFDCLQKTLRQIKSQADAHISPELAQNQAELPEKCMEQIVHSRIYLDLAALEQAIAILHQLCDIWSQQGQGKHTL